MAGLSRTDKAIAEACERAALESVVGADDRVPTPPTGVARLCIKEYATLYGVHASTVRRWIRAGRLQFEQPAGRGGRIFLKENPA